MAESKYGKYICTDLKKGVVMPGYKGPQTIGQGMLDGYRRPLEHVIWMDGEVIPGAFYAECTWMWHPGMLGQRPRVFDREMIRKMPGIAPHTHAFDEVLTIFGCNPNDPSDLQGEIEFWLEDEKFILTKSFLAYIPAGMVHCPLKMYRMDGNMFHYTVGPGQKYE
jgi:mannose-6-phosphate isomerase-like protein (cupin superfamily)